MTKPKPKSWLIFFVAYQKSKPQITTQTLPLSSISTKLCGLVTVMNSDSIETLFIIIIILGQIIVLNASWFKGNLVIILA